MHTTLTQLTQVPKIHRARGLSRISRAVVVPKLRSHERGMSMMNLLCGRTPPTLYHALGLPNSITTHNIAGSGGSPSADVTGISNRRAVARCRVQAPHSAKDLLNAASSPTYSPGRARAWTSRWAESNDVHLACTWDKNFWDERLHTADADQQTGLRHNGPLVNTPRSKKQCKPSSIGS
jgi:hypothetical protein